jgi:hypothetical protein
MSKTEECLLPCNSAKSIWTLCSGMETILWQRESKIERIQRRAVKWILSELTHSYNDLEYLMRLRDLDLLPLKERFITSDSLLFYDINHNSSCVKLPPYIKPLTADERRRLRPKINRNKNIPDNECLSFHKLRESRNDPMSLKCEIEPKSKVKFLLPHSPRMELPNAFLVK